MNAYGSTGSVSAVMGCSLRRFNAYLPPMQAYALLTDVSRSEQVEALAQRAVDAFRAVHLLFNNAGVAGGGGPIWNATEADWRWVLGVNLWGVLHGIRVFVPIMLKQDTEG